MKEIIKALDRSVGLMGIYFIRIEEPFKKILEMFFHSYRNEKSDVQLL